MPAHSPVLYSSSLSTNLELHRDKLKTNPEYAINQLTQKYDSYQGLLYRQRQRLSSTGEGSGDSSTTTSGSSSYGERDEESEGRTESEEQERVEREPLQGQISESERQQVETFFGGLKTQVYVCGSLANLYTGTTSANSEWQFCYTGIPVVLLDVGEARSRNKRRIQILLAERGTGFMLWRDTIDNLSSYKVAGRAFHTMCLSSDHSQVVGFSFDTAQAAHDMWNHIERLVACPENISLSVPGKKKKERKPKPMPLPSKKTISNPCCFQHVTSVDLEDRNRYVSLQKFVPFEQKSRTLVSEDL